MGMGSAIGGLTRRPLARPSWEEGEEQSYLVKNGKTIRCKTVCNVPAVSLGTQVEVRHDQSSSESSSSDDEK